MPIFSIIIPTRNAGNKIAKTLTSVIRQNPELYEVIVIDGHSEDDTTDIINHHALRHPDNIRWISEPDNNIFDAMNKGISLAKGEYLYFLGAGDTLRENLLESVSTHLSYEPEIVYGDVFDQKNRRIWGGEFDRKRISHCYLCHQAVFYKKEAFDMVGKYETRYVTGADAVLNIRIFGRPDIRKRHADIIIADFEGGGSSEHLACSLYAADLPDIIADTLGKDCHEYYVRSGRQFFHFLRHFRDGKVLIFGDGDHAREICQVITRHKREHDADIQVLCLISENPSLWDTESDGVPIIRFDENVIRKADRVITTSGTDNEIIINRILSVGVDQKRVIGPMHCVFP